MCWTNACSYRVTYLQQRMAWNRRGQADLSTSLRLSASPLQCPIRFRWHGLPKLEKWDQKHTCGTLESFCSWAKCGALARYLLTQLILSSRPIPCLFTWWGSWRRHSSCRDWRWRGSETQITPERWVIAQFTSVVSCSVAKAHIICMLKSTHVNSNTSPKLSPLLRSEEGLFRVAMFLQTFKKWSYSVVSLHHRWLCSCFSALYQFIAQ